jgi:copper chaperone
MERTFEITGMTCGHCVMTLTEAIGEVNGVTAVQVDLDGGTAVVRGGDFGESDVRAAVDAAGYGTR